MASPSHTLVPLAELSGHSSSCWSLSFHPQLPLLASCSSDKSIRIYSYSPASLSPSSSTAQFGLKSVLPAAHSKTIRQVQWSGDGRRLASASFDGTVGIWERTGQQEDEEDEGEMGNDDEERGEWEAVGSLEGHESEVKSIAFSSNSSLLATCGRDKSVWIWDCNTPDDDFECLAVNMDHTQDVKCVAWSPTEEILASASYDDTIHLYACDYSSDEWLVSHILPPPPPKHYHLPGDEHDHDHDCSSHAKPGDDSSTGHSSTVWACVFSPCGNYLASCSDDKSIIIWARYKKENVGKSNEEGSMAFRVGRTEKEGWYNALQIEGAHDQTIYSIDWIEAEDYDSAASGTADKDATKDLGRIASVGGDGKLCVFSINAAPDASQRNKYSISSSQIASVDSAHGVYDINSVQWCRLGRPSSSTTDTPTTGRWQAPPSNSDNGAEGEDGEDDLMGRGRGQDVPDEQQKRAIWKNARNVLATTGDDGSVRVWRIQGAKGDAAQ